MCVIVDANLAAAIFDGSRNPQYSPILTWLFDRKGKLVFGGRNARELHRARSAARAIAQLSRAGKAIHHPDDAVDAKEGELTKQGLCVSDDPHVIALAQLSGARTLCTRDQDLHQDFRNRELIGNPRGSVYQNASHKHLLRHTAGCPG